MIKIFLFLLFVTFSFAQIIGNTIIEKHPLEIGNWINKYKESNKFLRKPLKNSVNNLRYNRRLEYATENDIWRYFLSSKTTTSD